MFTASVTGVALLYEEATMKTLVVLAALAEGLQSGPDDLYVRVVDVGAGLCTVTAILGDHYVVYEAGHWTETNCLGAEDFAAIGSLREEAS